MSHNLKSPLRGIRFLADFFLEDYADKIDAAGKENIRAIAERTKIAAAILFDAAPKQPVLGRALLACPQQLRRRAALELRLRRKNARRLWRHRHNQLNKSSGRIYTSRFIYR